MSDQRDILPQIIKLQKFPVVNIDLEKSIANSKFNDTKIDRFRSQRDSEILREAQKKGLIRNNSEIKIIAPAN